MVGIADADQAFVPQRLNIVIGPVIDEVQLSFGLFDVVKDNALGF